MNLRYDIVSKEWWKAASIRALRTATATLIPLLAATTLLDLNWAVAGSTVLLSVIASYITSLAGLKELTDSVAPKWLAVLVRAVKQFAQTAAGYLGAAVLLSDVQWNDLLVVSVTAMVMSVLQSVLTSLPETQPVVEEVAAVVEPTELPAIEVEESELPAIEVEDDLQQT